ncbi:MAG: DUF4157 domain-containing protein [Pyrinomonadaceae bacterium]
MSDRTSIQVEKPSAAAPAQATPVTAFTRIKGTRLQRSCGCGDKASATGDCDECGRKKLSRRASGHDTAPRTAPPIVGEVLNGTGRPLDDATRAFMEPRFGHHFGNVEVLSGARASGATEVVPSTDRSEVEADEVARQLTSPTFAVQQGALGHDFSRVRVHHDSKAAESARALNARAYSIGDDIVFAEGQYQPATSTGRELIAHELTHVVQSRTSHSPQIRNALHCKQFDANESDCTATMTYLVQLLFKDEGADKWETGSVTLAMQRKADFRRTFKQSIEGAYNGNPYLIKPGNSSFKEMGFFSIEESPCPCASQGFKPQVKIELVKDGELSAAEDWEVDVAANPSRGFIRSSNWGRYADLNEASGEMRKDLVKQIPAAHEFGHFLGLDHPGAGLGLSKPNERPEYKYSGHDIKGREVDGPRDLMGRGMGLRSFYFDPWRNELKNKYGAPCGWEVIDPNAARVKDPGALEKPERSVTPQDATAISPDFIPKK